MHKIKPFLLLIGDIIALYASLFIMLFLRYGGTYYQQFIDYHAFPLTIVFIPWLVIFYAAGFYNPRRLHNNIEFVKIALLAMTVNASIAIAFFYLIPVFGITPKTNLFLFMAIFMIVEIYWRRTLNERVAGEAPYKVMIVGDGQTADEIEKVLKSPRLGYELKYRCGESEKFSLETIHKIVQEHSINIIVVPRYFKKDAKLARDLYELLSMGIEIRDLQNFYETLFRKIPLSDLEESWFLENITTPNQVSEFAKRLFDIIASTCIIIITSPILLIIAVAIALTSRGPVIFSQIRIGKTGKKFKHYKFRTMKRADYNTWVGENDNRITPVGKVLRKTHLDELPQAVNVLFGQASLVGPRPDLVDYYEILKKQIPYYSIRTLMRPGVTGWAQVSYPITASLEETRERLAYDLYYLKNYSFALDLAILFKTIKTVFTASGQ